MAFAMLSRSSSAQKPQFKPEKTLHNFELDFEREHKETSKIEKNKN